MIVCAKRYCGIHARNVPWWWSPSDHRATAHRDQTLAHGAAVMRPGTKPSGASRPKCCERYLRSGPDFDRNGANPYQTRPRLRRGPSIGHGQHIQTSIQGLATSRSMPGGVSRVNQLNRSPTVTNLFVRNALQTMRVTRGTVQMFKRWDYFPCNALDVHGLSIHLYLCDAAAV